MKLAFIALGAGFVLGGCNQNGDVVDPSGAGGPSTRTEYDWGSRTGAPPPFDPNGSQLTPRPFPQKDSPTNVVDSEEPRKDAVHSAGKSDTVAPYA